MTAPAPAFNRLSDGHHFARNFGNFVLVFRVYVIGNIFK